MTRHAAYERQVRRRAMRCLRLEQRSYDAYARAKRGRSTSAQAKRALHELWVLMSEYHKKCGASIVLAGAKRGRR